MGRTYRTFDKDGEYRNTKQARENDKSFRKQRHTQREVQEPTREEVEYEPRVNKKSMFNYVKR